MIVTVGHMGVTMSILEKSYEKQIKEERAISNSLYGTMIFLSKFGLLNSKFSNHNQIYRYVKKHYDAKVVPRLYANSKG